jgi:hypothetical protein
MKMSASKLEFTDHSDNDWQILVSTQELANIFHHPAWSRLMQECYGYRPFVVVLRDANGNICAGLPMMEIESIFAPPRWVSIPFSDHCAPLYCDSMALRKLSEALTFQAHEPGTPKMELRWELPAQFGIQSSADFVLHTIQLDSALEKVTERIHHSHRRNIKTAQAHDVKIKFGRSLEDIKTFYLLHLQTRHRQGVPIQPYLFFELLHKRLIDQGLGFILLAYEKGQCLAGAVFLHWNHTLTYKYGASTLDGLSLRPNHLLFWNAIQWGCDHGFTKLDLGRSSIENAGLRDFKSRWGAQEKPLIYTSFSQKSFRISNHRLSKMMHVVIQKSPPWVCRLSGEILYKHFG